MSAWYCIPSARPLNEAMRCVESWSVAGYGVMLRRDDALLWMHADGKSGSDRVAGAFKYGGYGFEVNILAKTAIQEFGAQWIVTGGDDTYPDPNHTAAEIAAQCEEHFKGTFGVMQPTGDRYAGGCIDRIAGSPWMGREWCLRANGGAGPLWPEYTHCFVDEELQEVAQKLGVFWQRRDLIHLHKHFMRESDAVDAKAVARPIPEHLREATSKAHWDTYKALFTARKAAGFPGHEPLGVMA